MWTSTTDRAPGRTNHQSPAAVSLHLCASSLGLLCLAAILVLPGCGGASSSSSQSSGALSGNWQFTLTAPTDGSFVGGPTGGFLLHEDGKQSVTGAVVYSITAPQVSQTVCNSGSAPVTGTISGQTVTLTIVAGDQSFTLKGTLSSNGQTIMGTYSSTDGKGCGTAQAGLDWSAVSVAPLTGAVQGTFHSTGAGSTAGLRDQDFAVTGMLTQGENIGASNATITGVLTFVGYPCLSTVSVNGQISGSSVVLQLIGTDGLNAGQIGAPAGSSTPYPAPVAFESVAGGAHVLHGLNGYGVDTKTCKLANTPGDVGNICLAVGNSTTCTQPITLSPAALTFPPQLLGTTTAQTITLTNSDPSGSTLNGLSIGFQAQPGSSGFEVSDFNGLPNFAEQDTCASSPGASFSLAPQQSCAITVFFSPQQSCPWLPSMPPPGGSPPAMCPAALAGTVTVNSPTSPDEDKTFAVPVTGFGMSALLPSTPELDFGAEAPSEMSLPQSLSFTNQGTSAVQILPTAPACSTMITQILPRPLTPGLVPAFQIVTGTINTGFYNQDIPSITYVCDSDLTSTLPNFRISADTCSGRLLLPLESCNLQVTFVPQPSTSLVAGLDYFLELNTLQCTSTTTSDCEIDSGRFPVEFRANTPSPLRMSPGAGLDFGVQTKGQASAPQTITLVNDPNDPNAGTVNFTGNVAKGDYTITSSCVLALDPGGSCTLTVTFKPTITGFDPGTITIGYTPGQTQTIYLRGTGK